MPRGPRPAKSPPAQVSSVVQASPSSQGAVLKVCPQPVRGSQASSVHGLPSSQRSALPAHVPCVQMSSVVQASPSSQAAALGVYTHPVAGGHESSVHGLPSSQLRAARPIHLPPEQVSPVVQASKSSHEAVFGMCTQPVAELHESSVQTLPSSQLGGALPTHVPPLQMSTVVQASPSSHGAVLGVCTQPVTGLHESSVQTLPSLQLLGVPTHRPPAP